MIADKMKALVNNSSAIRAMFEEGKNWRRNMVQKTFMILVWEIPMCLHRLRFRLQCAKL